MLMLPAKESLTVEFKSEQKRPQSHDEIVDNVVALANTEGGTLYLGIEDDGTVTGVWITPEILRKLVEGLR